MTLIASVSGIRGTLGGVPGQGLTPSDIVRYVAAFGQWLHTQSRTKSHAKGRASGRIVIGRDARPSGLWCSQLISATLQAMGYHVLDTGLSTTPTTAMEVQSAQAAGGIVISASHNPAAWNALKLLNAQGELLSASAAQTIEQLAAAQTFCFATHTQQGSSCAHAGAIARHVEAILALELVDTDAIRARGFRVAIDAVHSTGAIALRPLLEALGVREVITLYGEPTGAFPHNPEPLPEHIGELCACVKEHNLDLGIAVDPDVDRLALVTEEGKPFGEEYTLVAVADYVLSHTPGPCVSNLSSSRALQDIALRHGQAHHSAAVGEAHVVEKMRACQAVIGGEGNGGVIYPTLHAGRDALVGVALFLSHLAHTQIRASALRAQYPSYYMHKQKVALPADKIPPLLEKIQKRYSQIPQQDTDGLRMDFPDAWVHVRPSNTEAVLRIYTEARTAHQAAALSAEVEELLNTHI